MKIILTVLIIACSSVGTAAPPTPREPSAPPMLIPYPVSQEIHSGEFVYTSAQRISAPEVLADSASMAAEQLGLKTEKGGAIRLAVDAKLPNEGYTLNITSENITITGGSEKGVFYGIQTLRQMVNNHTTVHLPCLTIQDAPRFAWRGLMLDCSRTFQSIDYLKKTIDRLAYYKMNVLHLHLTDDQGWRMEIKSHPELTQKGAKFSLKYNEPARHEGFYTQAELRDLVKYASRRGVTIVPEIEMPGHSLEVLVCYPHLSCTGKIPEEIFPFFKGPNITRDILCAGNDETFKFLQDVLDEVIDVFPSTFIHIGGDEAPKDRWNACPKCQARMKTENLKNSHELQSWFLRRIEKYINEKGRRLIGWSEILEGGLAPNAAVMDWIGGAEKATQSGHDAVMSPTSHCYFDYDYKAIDSQRVYSFDPINKLSPEQAKHILGIQANFWSHIDREPELVDKQLFPRLLPLAERAWSPASVNNWSEFDSRLQAHLPVLERFGIRYYRGEK